MTYHVELRIDGPVQPQAGNVYAVVTRSASAKDGGQHVSNPGTLALCMAIARETNKRAGQTLAHVKYVGALESSETP